MTFDSVSILLDFTKAGKQGTPQSQKKDDNGLSSFLHPIIYTMSNTYNNNYIQKQNGELCYNYDIIHCQRANEK
jgi:hypothetical protein